MKKYLWIVGAFLCVASTVKAQKKDFSYKFYGQIRTDLFYNSRSNVESVDGLFYMFPKDVREDANGKDLNDAHNSNFYTLYTRLGMDIQGPVLMGGKIKTSAKVEADFRGAGSSFSTVRLRQAYFKLSYGASSLLAGQTWHPLYGSVTPDIMNLNMGAPYQPFSRAPQIRYQYSNKNVVVTAAALWQSQYLSAGPASDELGDTNTKKNQKFIKDSGIPELYVGIDLKHQNFLIGAGAHVSSLMPNTQWSHNVSENGSVSRKVYKADKRVTGVSGEIHMKYKNECFTLAAKSVLSSNLTQTSTVGGFGIKSVNKETGVSDYTPLRVSHSWINLVYGKKLKAGIFAGYLKNLGAKDELYSKGGAPYAWVYGTGTDIDALTTTSAELTYNLPNWKFGVEYSWTSALYGERNNKGKVKDTHTVNNNRLVFSALFFF